MSDIVTTIWKSTIQHGPHNDRVYLMKLAENNFEQLPGELYRLAAANGYSKIFAKIPEYAIDAFVEEGYLVEAYVPGLYDGRQDAYFLARYLTERRRRIENAAVLDEVLVVAKSRAQQNPEFMLSPKYRLKVLEREDAEAAAELYAKMFATYPFPIFDPEYIAKAMEHNVVYFGIFSAGSLAAVASAEMDVAARNVEMTDFAALPEHSGRGLGVYLLYAMEEAMREHNVVTAYTISRASSPQINITFARMGYAYAGTLINNTNIDGRLESMNVWYKRLQNHNPQSRNSVYNP